LHRERRKKTGIIQVALVGYTNAGKSTLLKQLTAADVYIQDQLFATLDPTSRTMELPSGKEIVLTDTVGFIQNLPHDLVAAFRATLEEVNEADLILHVVDASSEMREDQMSTVHAILQQLGAGDKPQLVLYNKKDACTPEQLEMLPLDNKHIKISALDESDLNKVRELIQAELTGDTKRFRIPAERGDLTSVLYKIGDVVGTEYEENDVIYQVELQKGEYEKFSYLLEDFIEL
jgi:GTP-binding protein HflX